MNLGNLLALTGGALIVLFALLRVERRARWAVVLFLAAPAAYLMTWWANIRGQWPETITAVALSVVITVAWWLFVGRKLPAPTSDSIKVWGQETAAKPKPADFAAMQAEVLRLREEKARLEAELKQQQENSKGQSR